MTQPSHGSTGEPYVWTPSGMGLANTQPAPPIVEGEDREQFEWLRRSEVEGVLVRLREERDRLREKVALKMDEADAAVLRAEGERESDRTDKLQARVGELEGERDRLREKLREFAVFMVDSFEDDFPECEGIDAESSMLCIAVDVAAIFGRDEAERHIFPLLADPGISDFHDRFRGALATSPPNGEPNQPSVSDQFSAPEVSQDCGEGLTAEQRQVMKAAADEYGAKLRRPKGDEPNHDPVGADPRCTCSPNFLPAACPVHGSSQPPVTDRGDGR